MVKEIQELDLLRSQVRILEERVTRLKQRNAWLEEMLKLLNKYHVLTEHVEGLLGSLQNPYADEIVEGLADLLEDE